MLSNCLAFSIAFSSSREAFQSNMQQPSVFWFFCSVLPPPVLAPSILYYVREPVSVLLHVCRYREINWTKDISPPPLSFFVKAKVGGHTDVTCALESTPPALFPQFPWQQSLLRKMVPLYKKHAAIHQLSTWVTKAWVSTYARILLSSAQRINQGLQVYQQTQQANQSFSADYYGRVIFSAFFVNRHKASFMFLKKKNIHMCEWKPALCVCAFQLRQGLHFILVNVPSLTALCECGRRGEHCCSCDEHALWHVPEPGMLGLKKRGGGGQRKILCIFLISTPPPHFISPSSPYSKWVCL